jgi:hypothetical protein
VGARVQRAAGIAHVDDLDRRQPRAVDALGQSQAPQRVDGLGTRRRAAGHEHCPGLGGAALSHAAGVVARVAFVLVGGIVLLVDDDEPEVADRREDRRARTDAHARLPRPQPRPLVVALASRELGVQDGDGVPEARDESRDDLRRQSDLRHEDDHAAPARQRRRRGLEVDLGLARAGDAVQEQPVAGSGSRDRLERLRLRSRELRLIASGPHRHVQWRAPHDARSDAHQPARLEATKRGEIGAGEAGQGGEQRALAAGEAIGGVALAAPGRAVRRPHPLRPQRRLRPRPLRRQQQRQRAGRGRAVLGCDPHPQIDQIRGEACLQDATRRDRVVLGAVGERGDHADHVAVPEWHDEHRADADAVGPQVVERPTQRAGRGQRLDLDYRRHRGPR